MIYKFNQHSRINENIQSAKDLLLKLAAEKKREKFRLPPGEKVEFDEEEKRKILQDPRFIELKDFLERNKIPNLAYPLAYFMFVEGLPMTSAAYSVENLFEKWKSASPLFQALPLPEGNDMISYIKSKKDTDTTPSYVKLWDDLEILFSRKPMKEYVDKFNLKPEDPIKKEFKKSIELEKIDPQRKKLISRLYNAVSDLKKLPPVTLGGKGEVQTAEDAEEQLTKRARRYTDYRELGGNPNFRDTLVAFEAFIEEIEDKIKSWGISEDVFIEELISIAPSIKILMYDKYSGTVVTSSRTSIGIKSLCDVSNGTHCIKSEGNFWGYSSGRLQISINQLNLDKDDNNYWITLTINNDKTLHDSKYRDNQKSVAQKGANYISAIKTIGLKNEEEIINSIEKSFYSELTIKNFIQFIQKGAEEKAKETKMSLSQCIIFSLGKIALSQAIENKEINEEETKTYKNMIVEILKKEKNIPYEEVVLCFTDNDFGGFYFMEDVHLFESLTENKYLKEDVIKIWEITKAGMEALEVTVEQIEDLDSIKKAKTVLKSYPQIANYVQNNML